MNEGPTPAPPPQRRLLKTAFYAIGAVALAAAGTIAYLVSTFDPRDYRGRIESLVLEKTGRTLDIQGEIALSFWPDVAVELGALALSERQSTERFASVENARVRLKLRPLLAREIVASELVIAGAIVHIVRHPDGRLNIDDLLNGEGPAPRFDIERLRVERSAVDYVNLASGARFALSQINLTTGRIAPGVITPVAVSLSARDGGDNIAMRLGVKGRLEAIPDEQRYAFHDGVLEAAGRIGALRDIAAHAKASFAARTQQKEFSFGALSLSMKAVHVQTPITATLEAARVVFTPGASQAGNVRLALTAADAGGTTDIRIESASISRDMDRLSSQAITVNLAADRAGYRVAGVVSAPLEVALAPRRISLAPMTADLTTTGARLPAGGVRAVLRGEGRLDLAMEALVLRLAGLVADSNVKANVTAANFSKPAYTFSVEVDQLDLKRYAGSASRGSKTPMRDVPAQSAQQLLAPLVNLPASGTLAIGLLRNGDVEARDVRLVLE
jgi:AsmA protein